MKFIVLLLMPLFINAQSINLLKNPEKHFHIWKTNKFENWVLSNGILSSAGGNGDLVTNEIFGDFVLEFEYKLPTAGNSGIVYKVIEDPDSKNLSQTYSAGVEYQLLDDIGYPEKIEDYQKTGSNYGINAPMVKNLSKPAGEWNTGKIEVKGDKIKHWLNGVLVVEYTYGDEAWKAKVADSKFAEWPYATPHHEGKIALQDHGDAVWFRKLILKKI